MKRLIPAAVVLFMIGLVIASRIEWKSDLVFSHKYHLTEAETECSDCHEKAETSTKGTDDLLPEMETCYGCHDEDDSECAQCHKQPDDPVLLPRIESYSVKFNHKKHMDESIACTVCHTGISSKDQVAFSMHLPEMDLCMTCHKTPSSIAGCYSCHQTTDNLKPVDHATGWDKNHGLSGEAGSENCMSCHTENYCLSCHQGENLQSEAHPPEFILTHSLSYLVRESDCASCHESRQFCIDCHMYANTAIPADHQLPGWDAEGHAESARMDYDRCAVCHEPGASLCLQCHN